MAEVPLRPFELELIQGYKTFSLGGRGGKSLPRKGVWIRAHLQAVGEDYSYGMWKAWVAFTKLAELMGASIEAGTYQAFRTYLWILRKHPEAPDVPALILPTRPTRRVGRAKTPLPEFQRSYYRLNPATLNSPIWQNPYGTYSIWQTWKRRHFLRPEAKRKRPRKKVRVIPGKKA